MYVLRVSGVYYIILQCFYRIYCVPIPSLVIQYIEVCVVRGTVMFSGRSTVHYISLRTPSTSFLSHFQNIFLINDDKSRLVQSVETNN